MFTVYAIYSKSIDKIYIGQTSDIDARLQSHREFNKGFTARASDWELIHSEEVWSRTEALRREKQLKSGNGRLFLRSLLKQVTAIRREADKTTGWEKVYQPHG